MRQFDIAPASLELEVTESLIADRVAEVRGALNALKALGVSIALDDFGTGFASLAYLMEFPVDVVKIDRTFVSGLPSGEHSLAIVTAMIAMSHALGKKVVAEGVETETQLTLLRNLGCDYAQGHLLSKPIPAEEFEQFMLVAGQRRQARGGRRAGVVGTGGGGRYRRRGPTLRPGHSRPQEVAPRMTRGRRWPGGADIIRSPCATRAASPTGTTPRASASSRRTAAAIRYSSTSGRSPVRTGARSAANSSPTNWRSTSGTARGRSRWSSSTMRGAPRRGLGAGRARRRFRRRRAAPPGVTSGARGPPGAPRRARRARASRAAADRPPDGPRPRACAGGSLGVAGYPAVPAAPGARHGRRRAGRRARADGAGDSPAGGTAAAGLRPRRSARGAGPAAPAYVDPDPSRPCHRRSGPRRPDRSPSSRGSPRSTAATAAPTVRRCAPARRRPGSSTTVPEPRWTATATGSPANSSGAEIPAASGGASVATDTPPAIVRAGTARCWWCAARQL